MYVVNKGLLAGPRGTWEGDVCCEQGVTCRGTWGE